jgi:AAA+ superfamily predicted ATPase
MDIAITEANAKALSGELQWLSQVIDTRMKLYWDKPSDFKDIYDINPPDLSGDTSLYAQIVNHYHMDFSERVILALSLAPHIMPQLLDVFFIKNAETDRGFTELGGVRGQQHSGFLPTGETAAFILTAGSLERRFNLLNLFNELHFFCKFKILKLVNAYSDEPNLSGALGLSAEYLQYFTSGEAHQPDYNINFPAKRIHSELNWDDLVLDEHTLQEVSDINGWIKYGNTILNDWGMKKHIKPGYRTLFYGPPGTGKTLTACLLGKENGLDVYRIDLSMVISKYIGETEKNLANIFDQAESKNWLLFFDEAEALFGKRSHTNSSNDRYSNQETSYLLQRIEDFPGVVMLATNMKANLDEAFIRRFQSMIYFPVPDAHHRMRLWENVFSSKSVLEEKINLQEIAEKYELTGEAINNIARYCSLMALKRSTNIILLKDIVDGISREFKKDDKKV